MQTYIDVSLQISKIMEQFTDLVEPFSIDEQFMDVTFSQRLFGNEFEIAEQLQRKILNDTSNQIFNQILSNVEQYQNQNYSWPIIDTIQLMPKEEIATVAETLLNLASLKKRVTIDTESVGGPIDVAIISKNDGLIWIKRKHYFNPDLNYRYFDNNK